MITEAGGGIPADGAAIIAGVDGLAAMAGCWFGGTGAGPALRAVWAKADEVATVSARALTAAIRIFFMGEVRVMPGAP
ncbi:hypothetical protein GCM10027256_32640 [Novispirillum itersonii subsp. nipponicum]